MKKVVKNNKRIKREVKNVTSVQTIELDKKVSVNSSVVDSLKKVNYTSSNDLAKSIKSEAHKFNSVRREILAFCATDKSENRKSIDSAEIVLLRQSKKDSAIRLQLIKLCAFNFKLITVSKESHSVERAYNVKNVLQACSVALQSDCNAAFVKSVEIERTQQAINNTKKAIKTARANVVLLEQTIASISDVALKETYKEKLASARTSLDNKVSLLNLATSLS